MQLISATEACFTSWLGRPDDDTGTTGGSLVVRNAGLCTEISASDRESSVFTLKVFLVQWATGDSIKEAVQTSKLASYHFSVKL